MTWDFSFKSVLCAFFLERVILLQPRGDIGPSFDARPSIDDVGIVVGPPGGREGGKYFTPTFEGVWR
jgi:hypothetical protein